VDHHVGERTQILILQPLKGHHADRLRCLEDGQAEAGGRVQLVVRSVGAAHHYLIDRLIVGGVCLGTECRSGAGQEQGEARRQAKQVVGMGSCWWQRAVYQWTDPRSDVNVVVIEL